MTEKEELEIIEEEEEEVEEMGVWSMDDLVELTEKVQSDYIVYRGKKVMQAKVKKWKCIRN